MKQWKWIVPAAILTVVTLTGAGCSQASETGVNTPPSGAQGGVDASVNAMENASGSEKTAVGAEDANATTVNDTTSLTNLGTSYDTNNF